MRTHCCPTALSSDGHGGRDAVHLFYMISIVRSVRGFEGIKLFTRQAIVRRGGFLLCI